MNGSYPIICSERDRHRLHPPVQWSLRRVQATIKSRKKSLLTGNPHRFHSFSIPFHCICVRLSQPFIFCRSCAFALSLSIPFHLSLCARFSIVNSFSITNTDFSHHFPLCDRVRSINSETMSYDEWGNYIPYPDTSKYDHTVCTASHRVTT